MPTPEEVAADIASAMQGPQDDHGRPIICNRDYTREGRCRVHGTKWTTGGCVTGQVLAAVAEHVQFQLENYGDVNRGMPDGTGPDVEWLTPVVDAARSAWAGSKGRGGISAYDIEGLLREEWDYPKDGTPEEQADAIAECTRMRLLREEVAEAFAQSDPRWLEAELIQVAALCVSWIADIRGRQS